MKKVISTTNAPKAIGPYSQAIEAGGFIFGVEICEDLWATVPPSSEAVLQGADVIFNFLRGNVGQFRRRIRAGANFV